MLLQTVAFYLFHCNASDPTKPTWSWPRNSRWGFPSHSLIVRWSVRLWFSVCIPRFKVIEWKLLFEGMRVRLRSPSWPCLLCCSTLLSKFSPINDSPDRINQSQKRSQEGKGSSNKRLLPDWWVFVPSSPNRNSGQAFKSNQTLCLRIRVGLFFFLATSERDNDHSKCLFLANHRKAHRS